MCFPTEKIRNLTIYFSNTLENNVSDKYQKWKLQTNKKMVGVVSFCLSPWKQKNYFIINYIFRERQKLRLWICDKLNTDISIHDVDSCQFTGRHLLAVNQQNASCTSQNKFHNLHNMHGCRYWLSAVIQTHKGKQKKPNTSKQCLWISIEIDVPP